MTLRKTTGYAVYIQPQSAFEIIRKNLEVFQFTAGLNLRPLTVFGEEDFSQLLLRKFRV